MSTKKLPTKLKTFNNETFLKHFTFPLKSLLNIPCFRNKLT